MGKAEKTRESWQDRKKKIKQKWQVSFVFIEWICECISGTLARLAIFDILEYLGRLSVLVSIVASAYLYTTEADDRRETKHYKAWQVINDAQGKSGSGGRIDALQNLNRDKVSLAGIDMSKAYLPDLNLQNANLSDANLAGANLTGTDFSGAYLVGANLEGVDLISANLAGANLTGAMLSHANLSNAQLAQAQLIGADVQGTNLTSADLAGADLARAMLSDANLAEARLYGANLAEARLIEANFAGADLISANFAGANLVYANLTGALLPSTNLSTADLRQANLTNIKKWRQVKSIEFANIYGVKDPPTGFIEWAKEHGAVSIESEEEWTKLIGEKKKQEAGNGRGDQKKDR